MQMQIPDMCILRYVFESKETSVNRRITIKIPRDKDSFANFKNLQA